MRFFYNFLLSFPLLIGCRDFDNKITAKLHNASVEVITDSVFTKGIEGPAMNSKGDLFVVNFKSEGTIGVLERDSISFKTFVNLNKGSVGNGIRFDSKDNMYVADYTNHSILFIENGTRNVQIYCQNKMVNQPNDLTLHKNGFGFASDPNWKSRTGNLLRFSEGKLEIIEEGMGTTNGIELSPDGQKLYVNETFQKRIWSYDVDSIGNLSNKKVLIEFDDYGLDGMRCDKKGNIYVTRYGKGVISVISNNGKLLYEILLKGKKPTNITFPKGTNTEFYVTLQDMRWIEKIKL
ncbi:MAG: gluconolactonase [Flavobacteriales bacterium]|nr:gluconolactonase [Flavobacteriales bacterium]|tara:strand:- start:3322 stop:4197 length:876 start_codon:yes stop_codon:yes gene_type:complete